MKIPARLIARDTADGTDFILSSVPLGKTYWIDPETIREGLWGKTTTQKATFRETVTTYEGPNGLKDGELPTELLDWEGKP